MLGVRDFVVTQARGAYFVTFFCHEPWKKGYFRDKKMSRTLEIDYFRDKKMSRTRK